MKKHIKANTGSSSTQYFDIQVEPNNELVRMIDLNGNYTEMYPEEAQELIVALQKAVEACN